MCCYISLYSKTNHKIARRRGEKKCKKKLQWNDACFRSNKDIYSIHDCITIGKDQQRHIIFCNTIWFQLMHLKNIFYFSSLYHFYSLHYSRSIFSHRCIYCFTKQNDKQKKMHFIIHHSWIVDLWVRAHLLHILIHIHTHYHT